MKGLIITGRDGTLVKPAEGKYLNRAEDMVILPGIPESIVELQRNGYEVAVATNQAGISLGYFDLDDFNRMCEVFNDALRDAGGKQVLHAVCPHGEGMGCGCRKPNPGLLFLAMGYHRFYREERVVVVGDYATDIIAGNRLHPSVTTIHVNTGRGAEKENFDLYKNTGVWPRIFTADFVDAVNWIKENANGNK
jgi:D-glycero-D-manno-heptose 1,7-bisphosphate phosphatase